MPPTRGRAESYASTADGLSHEFVLRSGTTFHNGERITAEDVKFSYQRYHGNAARFLTAEYSADAARQPIADRGEAAIRNEMPSRTLRVVRATTKHGCQPLPRTAHAVDAILVAAGGFAGRWTGLLYVDVALRLRRRRNLGWRYSTRMDV
jgi:hypothetical protein